MGIRRAALAGWCLFIILLFLTAFYYVSAGSISQASSWGARISIAIAETAAFFGAAVTLSPAARVKRLYKRMNPASRVYTSLTILTALTASFGVYLLDEAVSRLTGASYMGLGALYPALTGGSGVPGILTFASLALLPAICQEILLRGGIFTLTEEYGTAAAVTFSVICLPMIYVHPQAAIPLIAIGLACSLLTYCTSSVWPAVLTHICCRSALFAGEILHGSALTDNNKNAVMIAAAVMFLLFLFSLLRAAEGLLRDGLLPRFEKPEKDAVAAFLILFKTPGYALFFALYLTRLILVLGGVLI